MDRRRQRKRCKFADVKVLDESAVRGQRRESRPSRPGWGSPQVIRECFEMDNVTRQNARCERDFREKHSCVSAFSTHYSSARVRVFGFCAHVA